MYDLDRYHAKPDRASPALNMYNVGGICPYLAAHPHTRKKMRALLCCL